LPKQITVEWFKAPKSLSEIYQQTGMLFAFISSPGKGSKVCHEWVKCRDFLHDAMRSQITNTSCAIYGFTFNPTTNPIIDLKKTRMLISKDGLKEEGVAGFKKKMQSGLVLVNHFERYAKVSLSKLEEVDPEGSNKKLVYMFTGPQMWMTSPFLISMYTFLIRLGDKEFEFETVVELQERFKDLHEKYKTGNLLDNDANYIGKSWDKLHLFIKNRTKLFPKKNGVHDIFHGKYNINSFHNGGGIWSLSSAITPDNALNERVKELTKIK
jgi:hypothetical protein